MSLEWWATFTASTQKQWEWCISLTDKGFFQEDSLYFTKSGRGGRITEPPDDVSLLTFCPLNFKEALIKKKKSSYRLVWICKNLNSLFLVFERPPRLPFFICPPSPPVSSPCQSTLSRCLCQSPPSLFSHPGPLAVLPSPPFSSLSAIRHFHLYPPLLSSHPPFAGIPLSVELSEWEHIVVFSDIRPSYMCFNSL